MANADARSNSSRETGVDVENGVILDVGRFAYGDRLYVAAHDSPKPNTGVLGDGYATHYGGVGRNEGIGMNLWNVGQRNLRWKR
jgi:hypothetical protein